MVSGELTALIQACTLQYKLFLLLLLVVCLQITVAKKHSQKMAGFTALKAARLPACDLNNYVEPPLIDGVKLLHMIVTTPDRFDTCYQKQVSIACM